MPFDPGFIRALQDRLDGQGLLMGDAARERSYADWSEAPAVPPELVLRPKSPAEVASALKICSQYGQRLSVQGGLTGLAGGANPQSGEVVLSLERLNQIEDLDEVGGTVIAQAGVPLQGLQEAVERRGWFFPVDLGARGSSQLGGNAATNAGGNRVLRYGMMRENVLGIEVALADGTLLTMLDRVIKNNTGLDLKHLFIGSEGTLGVVTRLSLRLFPLAAASRTVLCALPDFDAATRLLREARRSLPGLSSFELMWASYFEASLSASARKSPLAGRHPLYVLIETLGADEIIASTGLESLLEAGFEDGTIADAVVAQSLDQANGLWSIREGIAELLAETSPNVAFDVSVPLALMGEFVARMTDQLAQAFPEQAHLFFGHLGDGNLHLLSGPFKQEADKIEIENLVYAAVQKAGGSISAEHGIGCVKRPFLHYGRPEAELDLMRRIKQTMDPNGILNFGRIIDGVPAGGADRGVA